MADHTPLLGHSPAAPGTVNGPPPEAVPGRDAPPRQLLADQTPFLSDAHLAARLAADQAMFDAHPGRHVAFVDTWDGPRLSREVVVSAPTVAEFYSELDRLDPTVRRRAEVNHVPDPDHLPLPIFLLD